MRRAVSTPVDWRVVRRRGGAWLRSGLSFAVLVLVLLAAPGFARAGLGEDALRVERAFRLGGRTQRLPPRLVARGERVPLVLPGWATRPRIGACTSLIVLGSPTTSFVLTIEPSADGEGGGAGPEPSQAGAVLIVSCGASRRQLGRVWLELLSPRGVVEGVVGAAGERLPSLLSVLPDRDPGAPAGDGRIGTPPAPPPLKERARAWSELARSDGAVSVSHRALEGALHGVTDVPIDLPMGCHRLSALGLEPAPGERTPDLDLQLMLDLDPLEALEDATENHDATLETCVARPTRALLYVAGLGTGDPGVLLLAHFPLPGGIPQRWGAQPRARLARALFARRYRGERLPVQTSFGVAGGTTLPMRLEPRTCYVVAAIVVRGWAKALRLRVAADGREAVDGDGSSAVVSLCTGASGATRVGVDAAGAGLIWLAAVWRSGQAGDASGDAW
jgi:hypothetical protein